MRTHCHRHLSRRHVGRISAVTSGDAKKDQRQDLQVQKLREAAQSRFESILSSIGSGTSQSASASDQDGSNTALAKRLENAINALQEGLVERDTEVRLLLLAALAGEHILFIGPPGTAKSELGRRLARLYDGQFFERLLTRFSVPEELFGPLSMRALEEDKYIRQIDGYLPSAKVAFIDEVFKANSAILNTLLTILNERLFDNGSKRIEVPLICLVGASNELPESEELDALYDRFLIRRRVNQVSLAGLPALLSGPGTNPLNSTSNGAGPGSADSIALSEEEIQTTRQEATQKVAVPEEIVNLLSDVRSFLQDKCEPPVYVSDRRLVKTLALLQVAAYTSGRLAVNKFDCLLLQHILWQRPDEAQRINDFLLERLAADSSTQQTDYLFNGMFMRACQATSSRGASVPDLVRDVSELRKALEGELAAIAAASGAQPAAGARGNELWLGADEAEAAATALRPKLQAARKTTEALLFEVVALEVALSDGELEAITLAEQFPERWTRLVRSAPLADIQPLGTRPIPNPTPPPKFGLP
ncbi:g80 [Coccomyxa elongata]